MCNVNTIYGIYGLCHVYSVRYLIGQRLHILYPLRLNKMSKGQRLHILYPLRLNMSKGQRLHILYPLRLNMSKGQRFDILYPLRLNMSSAANKAHILNHVYSGLPLQYYRLLLVLHKNTCRLNSTLGYLYNNIRRFGRKDHLTQHMRTHNRNRKENDRNSRNTEGNRNNDRT